MSMKHIYEESFSFWEIFWKALAVFWNKINYILLITLLIYVPINLVMFYVGNMSIGSPDASMADFGNYMRVSWRLENLIGVISSIFIIILAKDYIDGKERNFSELLKASLSKWPHCVWWNFLYGIGLVLLLMLLIIPGIIFGIYWIFFIYAIVLKDISVTKSFEYSKNLVKGRWWEMFGYWIFSLVSTIVLWFALWYIPYVETIYGDVISSLIIDLYASFVIIIFALKFLNIDRNKQEDNIEVWSENDKVIEL